MANRREFNRKTRREALARAAGKCQKCGAVLKFGAGPACEIDHILPAELGGEPTLANAMVLCIQCHREKTTVDVQTIRKADRARDKSTGAIRPKQSIPSPPKPEKPAGKQPLPPRMLFKGISHDRT